VAKGFFNQLNLDYSQYTILNWSFFGLAEDGSLHSADYRNKQIHQSGQVQAPAAVFNTDIYSSWDLWLFEGELEVLHYLPDDLDQNTSHELHWAFSEHGYKGNGSGWVHTDGRTGDYPLPLPKPNGAKGLIELAQNHGVKVMASIGGWSMSKHFPEMAADPVKRAKFVTACQNLIQKYGFDGIDLDWEFPGPFSGMNFTGSQADYANFTTLIAELRQGIGPDKLITAAFNASPTKLAGFDWNALSTTMDYFNMMSYDMHGGWSNKAGHNSPLYPYTGEEDYGASWDNTFQYLVSQGVAPAQINMGVGFYGRGVVTDGAATLNAPTVKVSKNISPDGTVMTASDYTNWGAYDGTPNFDYIMDNNSGWQQHWDNEAKVPYMTKDNYFLSYDNTQSITEKAQYVNSNQIGGVIVWQVFGDWDAGAITTTYANKLPYAPATKAPLVNVLNKVFAENTSLPNQAPVITMQQPTDGAQLEQADFEDIRLEVQITDTDGSVSSRDFTLNGNVVSFTQNGNTYVFDYTTSAYGANTLQVSATDNEGAQTQKEFTFSIVAPQNQGPSISFVSPTAGQSISQSDFEMVPITVTIADEDGSIANTDFNINGETVSFSNTGDSYTFDFLPSSYGTVNLEVAATDEAGETTSATLTFEIKAPITGGPFSELLTEASFNELFPHRFGVGSNNKVR
jgi:GH18 family chitinase/predicted 3-demethylubiquinone-9 3-methyltransferase (glyoxalase superfamily)